MPPKNNDLFYKKERNKFNENPAESKYVILNDVQFFANSVHIDNYKHALVFTIGEYGERIFIKIDNIKQLKVIFNIYG